MAKELGGENFDQEVLKSNVPVLVDFWAAWCGPCRALNPTINELDMEADGKYKVFKVNADTQPDLLVRYDVSALPTMIVFKNGQEVNRILGGRSKSELKDLLK